MILTQPLACHPLPPSIGHISRVTVGIDPEYKVPYQGLCSAVQSMSVIASKFRIGAIQRRISRGFGFLDAGYIRERRFRKGREKKWDKQTHCGGPCATGCAARSSLTLFTRFRRDVTVYKSAISTY